MRVVLLATGTTVTTPRVSRAAAASAWSLLTTIAGRRWPASSSDRSARGTDRSSRRRRPPDAPHAPPGAHYGVAAGCGGAGPAQCPAVHPAASPREGCRAGAASLDVLERQGVRVSTVHDRTGDGRPPLVETGYTSIQDTPEFAELRSRFRRFVFPMTGLFLVWYFLFVLLSSYAPDFMAHKIAGNITTGLVIGLLQFVSTFVITMLYARWANRHQDPIADELRQHIEGRDL
jgi:uncharacterized membrane protein (DUF485 family)